MIGLPYVLWYVEPFWHNTGIWQTDNQTNTITISELHWLPVNSNITFKLAYLTYKLPVNLLTCTRYYTITPLHTLYGRLTNFSSTWRNFRLNLVKDHLITWLLQSRINYLLISDFHPLSIPSNAVWKLTFSNSPSTPLPCCSPSDCQRLWFSTTTECVHIINACIIHNNNINVARRHCWLRDKKWWHKPAVDALNVVIILVLKFLCDSNDGLHSLLVCIYVRLDGFVLLGSGLDCCEVVAEVVLRHETLVFTQPRLSHPGLAIKPRCQLLQFLLSAKPTPLLSTVNATYKY